MNVLPLMVVEDPPVLPPIYECALVTIITHDDINSCFLSSPPMMTY